MSFTKVISALVLFIALSCHALSQKTTDDDYATSTSKNAQKPMPKKSFRDRLVYGGNVGGYLGTVSYLQLNPMVGYKVNDWWVNGVGLDFTYLKSGGIQQVMYGPNIWSRAYVFDFVILQTEVEQLYFKISDQFGNSLKDQVPLWLVGGGYRGSSGFGITVLFDLIQDPNSPYGSMPIIRIGGLIGRR